MWGDALPLGHGCSAKEPKRATLPATGTMSPCPSPHIGAGSWRSDPAPCGSGSGVTPCPHHGPSWRTSLSCGRAKPAALAVPSPRCSRGLHPAQPAGDVAPQGAASQARGSAAPGENNGTSLPRPLSQGQQWQEPESEPPELISSREPGGGWGGWGAAGCATKAPSQPGSVPCT